MSLLQIVGKNHFYGLTDVCPLRLSAFLATNMLYNINDKTACSLPGSHVLGVASRSLFWREAALRVARWHPIGCGIGTFCRLNTN